MDEGTNLEDVQQHGRDFLDELYGGKGVPMAVVNKLHTLIRLAFLTGQSDVLVKESKSIFPWMN